MPEPQQTSCQRCGECCRQGSPTLLAEDRELVAAERIPWAQLVTLRRGEPVRSAFTPGPFFLELERIKVRERAGAGCVFLAEGGDACSIYPSRPAQCRAQACWAPEEAEALAEAAPLTRRHLLAGAETLWPLLEQHERRCAYTTFREAFEELGRTAGGNVEAALELLAYEDHFRRFVVAELGLPAVAEDLLFGRSLVSQLELYGFRVEQHPDGTRTLCPIAPAGSAPATQP